MSGNRKAAILGAGGQLDWPTTKDEGMRWRMSGNRKAAILGAGGQLGWELGRRVPPGWRARAWRSAELDIVATDAVRRAFAADPPQVIINAAAFTAVDRAESEPERAYAVNAEAPAGLALLAREFDARLLHVSTDYVFDGAANRPYRPDAPTAPLGVYGASKLAGERNILRIAPERSVLFRTAWLHSSHGANFPKTMLRLLRERDHLRVIADQIGTPSWAGHLAAALWRAAEQGELAGCFHWTDAGAASWYDVAVAVREEGMALGLLREPGAIEPVAAAEYPLPAPRPAFSLLECRESWRRLELFPGHWREGLRRMLSELVGSSGS